VSEIKTTYAEAMKFCPVEACAAIAKLQASKSKFRKTDPAALKWTFFWGYEIKCEGARDIFSPRAARQERRLTLVEMIDKRKGQTFVSVCVKGYGESLPKGVIPAEILKMIVEGETEQYNEQVRSDALTPEQREVEVNNLLRQLGGMGGFAVVVPK
jgi:hypothetical protein